jgi:hypothetical protein
VNHDKVDPHPRQEDDVLGEPGPEREVVERRPADLDDEGPTAELLDIRQCLDEDARLVDDCLQRRSVAPAAGDVSTPLR